MPPPAPAALLAACDALRGGLLDVALENVDTVLGCDGDPRVSIVAARLAACIGRYDRALCELERVANEHPAHAPAATRTALDLTRRLGWDRDTERWLTLALARDPVEPRLHAIAVRLYRRLAPELALAHARRLLETDPAQPAVRLELASLAAELGDALTAANQVERVLTERRERPFVLEAAQVLFDAARVDAANELIRAELDRHPDDTDTRALLARFELRAGHLAAARDQAEKLHALAPENSAAWTVRGALALLEGRTSDALELLDGAVRRNPNDSEALTWRAQAHLANADPESCRKDAHRASMLEGHPVPARLLHLLASTSARDPAPRVYAARLENLRAALLELCPDAIADLDSELHERVVPVLWRALDRLGSNRSASPTWIDERGTLHRLRHRGGVRSACREALERIRCQPVEQVLARMDELVVRHPESSLPACHRGELLLWLGRTQAAREDFEHAIRIWPETRFAYIGLAGCALLEGNAECALFESDRGVAMMHGSSGPAVYAYRGEALYRLGRLDEARRDLERACSESPTRLGSRIALALVRAEQDGLDGIGKAYTEISARAPGLVSDAANALSIASHRSPLPATRQLAILERALRMLSGNRSSSCFTYFTAGGVLRSTAGRPASGADVHARDQDEISHLQRALQRLMRTR